MKTPAPYLTLLLLILTSFAQGQTARWANPRGFFAEEKIEETEIRPGIRWIAASGKLQGQPLRTHVIAVDLARSELGLQALLGERFVNAESGQFVRRSTTSQLLEDNQALAAINVAFFDIGSTQAYQGLVLRDGVLLREPDPARPTLIYHPEGRAALADFEWEGQVRIGSNRRPLHGINRPQLGREEVVLYLQPWSRSPGSEAAFTQGQNVRELLVEKTGFEPAASAGGRARLLGRILELREGTQGVEIGPNQFVLSAGQSASSFFRNAAAGEEIEVNWQLKGSPSGFPWHELREAVSAQPLLIRDGRRQAGSGAFWEGRHPRSAAGISRDGRQVLLVLVDGRSQASAGISLTALIDYLAHMGAYQAMNFDGGGSSALAARVGSENRLLNTPSDGRERLVPTGLAVISRTGETDLRRPRTWTGANGRQMTGIFQDYDPASGQVTLILDGRRFTFPLNSLSPPDQELILQGRPKQ
jgi:hypothetical protein